jgi:hypothetical protein
MWIYSSFHWGVLWVLMYSDFHYGCTCTSVYLVFHYGVHLTTYTLVYFWFYFRAFPPGALKGSPNGICGLWPKNASYRCPPNPADARSSLKIGLELPWRSCGEGGRMVGTGGVARWKNQTRLVNEHRRPRRGIGDSQGVSAETPSRDEEAVSCNIMSSKHRIEPGLLQNQKELNL